jgi:hypothetical protein
MGSSWIPLLQGRLEFIPYMLQVISILIKNFYEAYSFNITLISFLPVSLKEITCLSHSFLLSVQRNLDPAIIQKVKMLN